VRRKWDPVCLKYAPVRRRAGSGEAFLGDILLVSQLMKRFMVAARALGALL